MFLLSSFAVSYSIISNFFKKKKKLKIKLISKFILLFKLGHFKNFTHDLLILILCLNGGAIWILLDTL